MSRTFDIACTQCKKALWLGQAGGGSDRGHIYTGHKEIMVALNEFLWDHVGHPLVFCNDVMLDDYEEIEPPNVELSGRINDL